MLKKHTDPHIVIYIDLMLDIDLYTQVHGSHCRRGWMAGQSFPDCLCRLMALDGVPNMQHCEFARERAREC